MKTQNLKKNKNKNLCVIHYADPILKKKNKAKIRENCFYTMCTMKMRDKNMLDASTINHYKCFWNVWKIVLCWRKGEWLFFLLSSFHKQLKWERTMVTYFTANMMNNEQSFMKMMENRNNCLYSHSFGQIFFVHTIW